VLGAHRIKAETDGWLAQFPMFDWMGGRTSVNPKNFHGSSSALRFIA